ncbi:MAG: hypothetical protein KAW84_05330 [Thermoplasmata archaeon]|nr:hypothetical protein [Thermoplasmata archaeon]
MKLVYCPSCDEVLVRSRIEGRRCPACGGGVEKVDTGLSWQYVTSWIVLLLGAAMILLLEMEDMIMKILLFVLFAIVAFAFSSWGVEDQKKKALSKAREVRKE